MYDTELLKTIRMQSLSRTVSHCVILTRAHPQAPSTIVHESAAISCVSSLRFAPPCKLLYRCCELILYNVMYIHHNVQPQSKAKSSEENEKGVEVFIILSTGV